MLIFFSYLISIDKPPMANLKNVKSFLGYGGPGQPLGPPFNPDRAGEPLPPTGRELVEYAIHLSSEFEGGGGNFPQEELIK